MVKLAIVARVPAPYRIHQHLRIARELGDEVELRSIFLYEHNNLPWSQPLPEAIRPVVFGPGQRVEAKTGVFGWLRELRKMSRVIRWLKEQRVDAVVTVGYSHPGSPRLIRWCRRTGTPNFLYGDANVHGDRVRGLRRWLKQRYVGWVVRTVTGILPHSLNGRRYFDAYGGRDKPVFYVPQEPDYQQIFSVTAAQRAAAQTKFGLRDDRKYFLFSGRLVGLKRIDTLIDAFARIANERSEWDLLIVGSGPLENELKARVPASLRHRVVWTGFVDDAAEMAALYACSDVFILPSNFEQWSLVMCEAAAAGLPIISSEVVGAAGELVREGVNGWLFPPGDVKALAKALLDVTASDERLQSFSRSSLEVLDDWRRRGDPIHGLRQALAHAGLLAPPAQECEPVPATPRLASWRCVAASS
jgi:glycosyltransferase involved in cell wall biosynthesis